MERHRLLPVGLLVFALVLPAGCGHQGTAEEAEAPSRLAAPAPVSTFFF